MTQMVEYLPELFFSLLAVAVGWSWGELRARREWQKKEFTSEVVLSLNLVGEASSPDFVASLKLRTLFERRLEEVFPNPMMRKLILKSCQKTTPEDPLVRLPSPDGWYVLNRVLNQIAEMFSKGFLKEDLGSTPSKGRYLFCLTYEREGGIRAQKLRIMLIQKDKLLHFPDQGDFELENPTYHKVRVTTLRKLKELYQKEKEHFMEVEVAL